MTSPSSACLPRAPRDRRCPLEERGSSMSGYAKRVTGIVVGAAIVCVLLGLYIGLYLTSQPGAAAAAQSPAGAHLYLGTVPASEGTDPHPSWVSYYAVDATSGNWRHDTTFVVPANTVVTVTVYNYDGQSGLRNPFISQSAGDHQRRLHPQRQARRGRSTPTPPRTSSPSRSSACWCRSSGSPTTPRTSAPTRPAGWTPPTPPPPFTLPHGQAGAVSLAVLRALRGRLHRGLGRPDADGRLHGRLRQGRMRRVRR